MAFTPDSPFPKTRGHVIKSKDWNDAITEVQRMESDVITLQDIFQFKVDEVTRDRVVVGSLCSTGLRPAFLHKFEKRGVSLPTSLFAKAPQMVSDMSAAVGR